MNDGGGDPGAVRRNSAGSAPNAAQPYSVYRHQGLLATVMPGEGRQGMPDPVRYDPARGRAAEAARQAEVDGLVAAARAEALRRWEAAGRPTEPRQQRLPACAGYMCGAWRRGRCDTPCWKDGG